MGTTRAKRAQVAERRAQAVALRLAGMDWQSIADRLGYGTRGAACQDVSRALKAHTEELRSQVDELRVTESLRLDRLQAAVWPKALKGDTKSVDTALRVIDRRMRLLRLDRVDDSAADDARSMLSKLFSGLGEVLADQAADTGGNEEAESEPSP